MEESTGDFIEDVRKALNMKLNFINNTTLSNIKASVSEYRETLSTLITSLFNAGLLEKDLYQSTQMIHELKLPSIDPVDPSNRDAELSFRLYDYLKQFEYIEKDLNFLMDQLTIEEVEELITFFNFISWSKMSQSATSPVERIISKLEQTLKSGENRILNGIFRDCRSRLGKLENCILSSLEDLHIYLQERYKLDIRDRVVRSEILDSELSKKKIDEALLLFKKQVKAEMGEVSLNSGLIKSILEEDYSGNASQIRTDTLNRVGTNLTIVRMAEPKAVMEKSEDNSKLLMDAYKILAASGGPLIEVSKKLNHNADVIETVNAGFIHRILCFLFGKKKNDKRREYDVIVFKANDETGQKIKIDLENFTEELTKTGYKLVLLGNKNSKTYLSLLQLPEKTAEEILTRYIAKITFFMSKLPALDLYMKNISSNAMRANMKGFKLDLNDIHSCLNKANKCRLEYQSAQIPAL